MPLATICKDYLAVKLKIVSFALYKPGMHKSPVFGYERANVRN